MIKIGQSQNFFRARRNAQSSLIIDIDIPSEGMVQ
jgi:hypothetical protein